MVHERHIGIGDFATGQSINTERRVSRPLNSEYARRCASELAVQMDTLGRRANLLGINQSGELDYGVYLSRTSSQPPWVELKSLRERVSGIGSGSIALLYNIRDAELHFARNLKVNTNSMLHLGLHMDEATMPQAQAFLEATPNTASAFQTSYYFDTLGNYGKLSAFPRHLTTRSNVHGWRKSFLALVESPMTPVDFELAGTSLIALNSRLAGIEQGRRTATH